MPVNFKIISTVGKVIFPSLLWNFNNKEKIIYLTFDDGPIPVITPWVLQLLKEYNAKATFFCIGHNVAKHPEVFSMILKEGHVIGNHSHNHLNGWKTSTKDYVSNVLRAEKVINNLYSEFSISSSEGKKLFRPPYGRITHSQIKALENEKFRIVMWDVISGDYDQKKIHQLCLQGVKKYTVPGSIVVFHDSAKAFKNLEKTLPEVLRYYTEEGYEFRTI